MSNLISEFDDTQKFNPMGFDVAANGAQLTKFFTDTVSWQLQQLPSSIKTVNPVSAPPDETTGNIYILHNNAGAVHANWDTATKNDVAYFNGTIWIPISPVAGQTCYDKERNCLAKYNGSKWLYEECFASLEIDVTDIRNSTKMDVASPVCSTDILEPITSLCYINFNANAYVNVAYLGLYAENNGSPLMISSTAFIASVDKMVEIMWRKDPQEIVIGDKLQVATSANVNTGDSKITIYVKYRLIQL